MEHSKRCRRWNKTDVSTSEEKIFTGPYASRKNFVVFFHKEMVKIIFYHLVGIKLSPHHQLTLVTSLLLLLIFSQNLSKNEKVLGPNLASKYMYTCWPSQQLSRWFLAGNEHRQPICTRASVKKEPWRKFLHFSEQNNTYQLICLPRHSLSCFFLTCYFSTFFYQIGLSRAM